MSSEEARSSELETSLSSSEDHGAFEVTSPSTPHKAWGICCSLKKKDKKMIRDRFQLPSSVNIRIPNGDDKACHSYADEVYFYEANFVSELRFPIHPFIRAFLPFATRSSLVNAKLMENSDLLYGDTDVCQ